MYVHIGTNYTARGFAELHEKGNLVVRHPWRCLRFVGILECFLSWRLSRPTLETPSQVYQQVSLLATTNATASATATATATAVVAVALELPPNGGHSKAMLLYFPICSFHFPLASFHFPLLSCRFLYSPFISFHWTVRSLRVPAFPLYIPLLFFRFLPRSFMLLLFPRLLFSLFDLPF